MVDVAAAERRVRERERAVGAHQAERALETQDAREQLGSVPDLGLHAAPELTLAVADATRQVGHAKGRVGGEQVADAGDGGVAGGPERDAATRPTAQQLRTRAGERGGESFGEPLGLV